MLRSIVTVLLLLSVFILTGCTDSSAVSEYDATLEARSDEVVNSATESMDYLQKGKDYFNRGDYQQAIEQYDEAIRLDPQYADAYFNRGRAYSYLGQHEQSKEDLDEAIRLNPQHAMAYNNRGIAYGQLGQYERAIEDFDEAIRLDSQDAKAYNYRGVAYGQLGQYERAIQDLDEAIRLNPQEAGSYDIRGTLYQSLGEDELAERDFQKGIGLATPTPTLVPTATATATPTPIKTTVGQLSRDYESNSVVANLKYGNRNVEIRGTVDSVDIVALDLYETYNYVEKYVLELTDSDYNYIRCVFPDLEQATSTKKGEQVTVTGRILGNSYREVGRIMVHPCRLAAGPN